MEEKYISLKKAAKILGKKGKNFTPGYLSSLARKGKLKAMKIGVEWITTEKWINRFTQPQKQKFNIPQNKKSSLQSRQRYNMKLKTRKIKSKRERGLVLPLYFGWQIRIILERVCGWQNKMPFLFKRYSQYITAVALTIGIFVGGLFFYNYLSTKAATYGWVQTDWSGGQTANTASHSSNQTGWTEYSAQDGNITAAADLTLTQTTASSTIDFTTESNYAQEDAANGTDFGSGVVKLHNSPFACGSDITFTYRGNSVTYGTVSHNDECWLDRNLGASQTATTYNDSAAYGDLFQWGRLDDNHQDRNSNTTDTQSSSDNPGHSNFILSSVTSPYDWRNPQNDNLWQGVDGINNPCPDGWRIPTETEWETERASWSSSDYSGAYASPLKLAAAGYRDCSNGNVVQTGILGVYWSSTVIGSDVKYLFFKDYADIETSHRAMGRSVRCIKEPSISYPTTQSYYITTATGSQLDTSTWTGLTGASITQTTPTNTSIKYFVSFDNKTTWKYWDGSAWQTAAGGLEDLQTYGMSKATLEAITQAQWESTGGFDPGTTATLDFAADLKTTDSTVTPELDQIQVNYLTYPSSQTLTSSAYDTSDPTNAIGSIAWTETLPANTDIKFQIRTAPDNSGAPGTWTDWCGPDDGDTSILTCDTSTYFTDSAGGEAIDEMFTDGSNDQWIQYKVWLESSDGTHTPILSDVTLTYVINAPPEFNSDYPSAGAGGVSAIQNSDGTVTINYSVRDPDTNDGTANPGYITPSFEYWNGSSWVNCTTMDTGDTDNKTVEETNYSVYSATWYPKTDFNGQYMNNTAKIRVTINDNEGANNTATQESAVFTLDTEDPAIGSPSLSVDASQSPANLTLSCADDTSLEMKISLNSDLSGASWQTYSSSSTISLATDPDIVYVQFKDAYGNTSSIISSTTPETPTATMVQDTSNTLTTPAEYRLFVAWKVVDEPAPGFGQYQVYRSSDGTNYSLLTTIADRTINYYGDSSVSFDTTYYYKITAKDANNNISYLSTAVYGKANGIQDSGEGGGGSETTPPVITNIETSSLTTNSVTITWDTNELSNSTVSYSTTSGSFTTEQGVSSMVTSHSVTLSGLTPNTTYYYQIKSTDPSSNAGTDNNSGPGYSFTTAAGPVISDVLTQEVTNNTAKISWTTNTSTNSYVIYSTSSDMSGSSEYGSPDLTTSHSVTIPSLTQGTKYYYYVKSIDAESNTAYDKNVVNGKINYYNFTTTKDTQGPVISSVTAAVVSSTSVVITWKTNEDATSQVAYGTSSSYGSETTEDTNLTIQHSVTITGLTKETTYYYKVTSKDASSNSAEDDNSGNSYTFTTTAEPGGDKIYIGGGGVCSTDKKAPVISNIIISDITSSSATISWETNEKTDTFVEYGLSDKYLTGVKGQYESEKSHSFTLSSLLPGTTYHFRALGKDDSGNLGHSQDQTFTTLGATTIETTEQVQKQIPEQEKGLVEKAVEILKTLSSSDSLSFVSNALEESASRVIGPPLIAGKYPKAETGNNWAKISWVTDKKTNSFVAIAKENEYEPTKEEPYAIISGNPDEMTTTHTVKLENLQPSTIYHYQVRSKAEIGDWAKSNDKTFTTLSQKPEIKELNFTSIGETKASFSWITTLPTKTKIELTNTETGEKTTQEDPSFLKEHTFEIKSLQPVTSYALRVTARDEKGNQSVSPVFPFSTSISKNPPIISNVRVTTALIPGKIEKIQAIISWKTDKPSTSRIYYQEGVNIKEKFVSSSPLDKKLVLDHTLVTTAFKPGKVYQFKAESIDSFDNQSLSKIHTILTPRPKKDIVDLIIKNLEDTFGFLKRLKI